jgi:hypothetical protein
MMWKRGGMSGEDVGNVVEGLGDEEVKERWERGSKKVIAEGGEVLPIGKGL